MPTPPPPEQTPDARRGASPRSGPLAGPLLKVAGLSAALAAVLVVLLALFILPSLKSGAHDLPVGIVGTSTTTGPVEQGLAELDDEAYEVRDVATAAELKEAIRDRELVGGLVVTEEGIETVVATAGSPAISGSLISTAQALGQASGTPVSVTDLVPLPADDPTGVGIGGLAFPLVFGGIVPVVAFGAVFANRAGWRLGALIGFSLVGGGVVAAVLQFWFGSIESAFWPVAGAMALGIAALAVPLSGLQALFGSKGFSIAAASMMFLGNPLSGIATTGAWLPTGLGAFGQLLPPGAAGTLVRAAAYFDGAGGLGAALTLSAWVLAGLALHVLAGRRTARTEQPGTGSPAEPAPAAV
ncbi:hypothetical protein KG112_11915 [Nocardioides sp. zg-ZUI104]|uniref:hypothetical protein n=1 Tax=Nocardioides faecalis TaxID=2803858 RepID=UPI001BCE9CCF|nr:hypothetical protein [Nocardioides faecalis]MBS4753510.1 hypothetical protein [Nocardioides faecalis]